MKMVLLNYPNPPLFPIYANLSMRWHLAKNMQKEFLKLPSNSMKVSRNILCLRIHSSSIKSVYQGMFTYSSIFYMLICEFSASALSSFIIKGLCDMWSVFQVNLHISSDLNVTKHSK